MKTKYYLLFFCIIFLASAVEAGTVTRSFSNNNPLKSEVVKVDLLVHLEAGETFFLMDEGIPSEFTVTNQGSLIANEYHRLKVANLSASGDTIYSYYVLAPGVIGSYTFSGVYMIHTGASLYNIGGTQTITVIDATCSDNIQNQGETGIDCGGPCSACSTTSTSSGGGGGSSVPSCTPRWECLLWSSCRSSGKQTCLSWQDTNGCNKPYDGDSLRSCTYIETVRNSPTQEPEEEELIMPSPPIEQKAEITIQKEELRTDVLNLEFQISNIGEADIKAVELEVNVNKERITHYFDYLGPYDIGIGEVKTVEVNIPIRYLKDGAYEIKGILYGKGFKKAESSTTIDTTVEKSSIIDITANVIGAGGLKGNTVLVAIVLISLIILVQLLRIFDKKRGE